MSALDQTIERVARDAYGRVLARLAYQWRDLQAAEDALGDALALALSRWPVDGVPQAPDAWLLTTARNQLRQAHRHQAVATREDTVSALALEAESVQTPEPLGDHRLRLMSVCAHPAIDESIRTPLMLQTVLGLDAAFLARAFLVPGATMGQRLVRAKRKIRDAGIPFDLPEHAELKARIGAVIECVYAAFTQGAAVPDLIDESLYLGRVLVESLPDEPEALALLALMMFVRARAPASQGGAGEFVPLHEQDTTLWKRDMIVEAEVILRHAATLRRPGPFQLEAAIHSAHCQRLFTGVIPWRSVAFLYRALNHIAPTVSSHVAEAIALIETEQTAEAAIVLGEIEPNSVEHYAPFWLAMAHLARAIGDDSEEVTCLKHAQSLLDDPGQKAYVAKRLSRAPRRGSKP